MKKIISSIIFGLVVFVFCEVILYLMFSFVPMDFNAYNWLSETRFLFVYFSLIPMVVGVAVAGIIGIE